MDPLREGIVQLADKASLGIQNACQTFGFLPDGRELIDISSTEFGLGVTFSDRSAEGWPGFNLNLPSSAAFSHAMTGFLSRGAFWTIKQSPATVTRHLSDRNEGFPAFAGDPRGRRVLSLDNGVKITVGMASRKSTLLSVVQARDPDSIADAIRARHSKR